MRRAVGISARQRQIVTIRFIVPSIRQFVNAAASISSRLRVVVLIRFMIYVFEFGAIPILANWNGKDSSLMQLVGIFLFS